MSARSREWAGLGLFLLACFGVAALGGVATSSSVTTWYPALAKPSWTPPSWLFGPVWTALYALMAVAAWLVWRRLETGRGKPALALFALQLALNLAWSLLFFGLRSPLAGLVDIGLLWGTIVATAVAFGRIVPLAGWLFVPYVLWVSFATALNFAIVRLNG